MKTLTVPNRSRRAGAALAVIALLFAGACSADDDTVESDEGTTTTESSSSSTRDTEPDDTTATTAPAPDTWDVFGSEGNNLWAYEGEEPYESQEVIRSNERDPENGLDINAQICFWQEEDGTTRFIAGEDTHQPDPPAGWGIFDLEGTEVGEFEATQVGKLTPTYQEGDDNAENYGCGLLSDGRMLTTDIGNQALGAGTGQLIVWFPPFDETEVRYCKIDVDIPTAQSILVDEDDNVYVASSRGSSAERPGGVYKYSPPFPTSDDADGGCGKTDTTGAPLADAFDRSLFIELSEETKLATPAGLAHAPDGGFYVSSVFNGVINEYDADGAFVRTVLAPPEGEVMGPESFTTGTPLGIGVGPDGSLYYADIGVTSVPGELPGPGKPGSVRRITFVDGEPQAPVTMAEGLAFPDGIGIFAFGGGGGGGRSKASFSNP